MHTLYHNMNTHHVASPRYHSQNNWTEGMVNVLFMLSFPVLARQWQFCFPFFLTSIMNDNTSVLILRNRLPSPLVFYCLSRRCSHHKVRTPCLQEIIPWSCRIIFSFLIKSSILWYYASSPIQVAHKILFALLRSSFSPLFLSIVVDISFRSCTPRKKCRHPTLFFLGQLHSSPHPGTLLQ